MATNKRIGTLLFRIESDTKALMKGMNQTKRSVSGLKKSFSALAPIIAGAFSVNAIAGFTKEVIRLAGEAEGVEEAFSRLQNSEQLIKDLTTATRGTVSQLQLMKLAVQAKNFKIPLDKLATYFEFATKRAAQTGESVDYLVNSLITGVGRKSVLVMDNLGISAVALQEEVKRVGDFGLAAGNIIERELGNMGDVSKTTAQEVSALASTWENVKTEIGKAVIENVNLNESLGDINETLSSVDWKKSIDDLISGFQRWHDIMVKMSPLFGPIIAGIRLFKKEVNALPQKAATPTNYNTERTKIGGSGLSKVNPLVPFNFGGPFKEETTRVAGSTPGLAGMSGMGFSGFATQMNASATMLKERTVPMIKDSMMDLSTVMQQTFMGAVDAFGSGIQSLFAGTANLENFFQGVLAAFGGFITQMGKMIISYGLAMKALPLIALAPGAAIAAGAAMVALGSAISGLAAKGAVAAGGGGGSAGGGLASIPITGTTKIQGRDIVIAFERGSSYTNSVT